MSGMPDWLAEAAAAAAPELTDEQVDALRRVLAQPRTYPPADSQKNGRTRAEAIKSAAAAVADGIALRDSLPPREADELPPTPTGLSVDELERMIRASQWP